MSPVIHALDRARTSQLETQKLSRAEVEAAVRTIMTAQIANTINDV